MRKKIILLSIIAASLLTVTTISSAAIVRSGVQACGGSYFVRNAGLEIHDSRYPIRNHNDNRTITIDRVVAWNPDGTLAFDSDVQALPNTFSTILLPHQGTKLKASDLLGIGNPLQPGDNVMQVHFEYSLDARGYSLSASVSHVTTDNNNFQISRHHGSCRGL